VLPAVAGVAAPLLPPAAVVAVTAVPAPVVCDVFVVPATFVAAVALPVTGGAAGPPQAARSGTSSATRAYILARLK
jgi:hypothetical protein